MIKETDIHANKVNTFIKKYSLHVLTEFNLPQTNMACLCTSSTRWKLHFIMPLRLIITLSRTLKSKKKTNRIRWIHICLPNTNGDTTSNLIKDNKWWYSAVKSKHISCNKVQPYIYAYVLHAIEFIFHLDPIGCLLLGRDNMIWWRFTPIRKRC